jgi:hypothetical protein
MKSFARYVVAPAICAGALGAAVVGLAGTAAASTGSDGTTTTVRGPQVVATPHTIAQPWVPPKHHVVIVPVPSDLGGA